MGKYLDAAIERCKAPTPIRELYRLASGFHDFDQMTAGLQPSDLIILAARPSVGKTSLVLKIAENAALSGTPVGVFSLEMSSEQIAERNFMFSARVNLKHLRSGFFTKRDAAQLLQTASRIHNIPLYIDDNAQPERRRSIQPLAPPEIAATQPGIADHRLFAADVRGGANRKPPAGSFGDFPFFKNPGARSEYPDHRLFSVIPRH
jgi:predicted ATP-dependent serine protease